MRNLSMKKFGTPIGAAPGSASEKVGLSSVGEPSSARPGCFARAFFLASRSSSETSFLRLRLPALNCLFFAGAPAAALGSFLSAPGCSRLGAPGVSLPSGVGVEVGLGAPGTPGTAGTVGTGGARGAFGVGVAIGP